MFSCSHGYQGVVMQQAYRGLGGEPVTERSRNQKEGQGKNRVNKGLTKSSSKTLIIVPKKVSQIIHYKYIPPD